MTDRICIIILVSILFFLKTLTYKYCSDDLPAYGRPKHPKKWMHWLGVIEGRARHTPQADHFITMVIHTAVCVFIYLGFGANEISFWAALLFCVNPANNQASVWVAGRAYALSALGMTMILAIPWLSPLLLLAVTYFNTGFVAPVILLGSPYPWVVAFLPLAWLFHWKRFKFNVGDKIRQEMFFEDRSVKVEKLVLAVKTYGFYLVHGLLPIKTSFYHSFLQSAAGSGSKKAYTVKCRFFWIGILALVGAGYMLIFRPWSMVQFLILWHIVCIGPFLNFVRIQQEIAERYMYLPNVGLMVLLSTLIVHSPILIAVFLSVYATKLWFYMDAFQDDYYLVEYAALHDMGAWFALHVKAMKRWTAGSHQEALIFWLMARNISPLEFKLNLNIASVLSLSRDPKHREEAKGFFKIACENIPKGQEPMAARILNDWENGKNTGNFPIIL